MSMRYKQSRGERCSEPMVITDLRLDAAALSLPQVAQNTSRSTKIGNTVLEDEMDKKDDKGTKKAKNIQHRVFAGRHRPNY